MSKIYAIGLDVGNSDVKFFSTVNPEGTVLPNFLARSEEFEGEEPIWEEYEGELNVYETSQSPGDKFVWGRGVRRSQNPLSTYSTTDRYSEKFYRCLVDFSILESIYHEGLSEKEIIEVVLVTGCPSEEKGNETIEKQITKAFTGTKVVKRNDKEFTIKVKAEKEYFGIMAQPTSTLASLYFNVSGTKVLRPELKTRPNGDPARILILDAGGGTFDADLMQGMKPVQDKRKTISDKALNYAFANIAKMINSDDDRVKATRNTVEEAVLNKGVYYVSERKQIDLIEKGYVEKSYRELTEYIISQLNEITSDRDTYDKLLLTGGGAEQLIKYFQEWEKDVELVEGAQLANAKGYFTAANNINYKN